MKIMRKLRKAWERNRPELMRTLSAAGIALTILASSPTAYAIPQGGEVTAGQGDINQNGSNMTITQTTDKLALDWQSFNIGQNESVHFNQPSFSSIALNRILGNDPSQIFGRLSANGQVFLTNPNGVLFGRTAQVDVGGLVASTLHLSDSDFLAGRYVFQHHNGSTGSVINQGNIMAGDRGYVALLGPQVQNEGVIVARQGTVALAGGEQVTLDMQGDGVINLAVDQGTMNAQAVNKNLIQADGGQVVMTAKAVDSLIESVVNNEGIIQAHGLAEKNGRIVLDGGNGLVQHSGILDTTGKGEGQTGGYIAVTGRRVGLLGNAVIDASGDTGGGQIYVGGGWQGKEPTIRNADAVVMSKNAIIQADAIKQGNGGTVVLWSNNYTGFFGNITAKGGVNGGNGGNVETSSHNNLQAAGHVDASALNGRSGNHLLDPYDVKIVEQDTSVDMAWDYDSNANTDIYIPASESSIIRASDITNELDSGTNVMITTNSNGGGQYGDISVLANINRFGSNEATLTLQANGGIYIGGSATGGYSGPVGITSANGKLNIVLHTNYGSNANGGVKIHEGSKIETHGGNVTIGGGNNPLTDYAVGSSQGSRLAASGLWLCSENYDGKGMAGAKIDAQGGNIIVHGKPRPFGGSDGIWIGNGAVLTSNGGSIELYGNNNTDYSGDGVNIQGTVSGNSVLIEGESKTATYGGVSVSGGTISGGTVNIIGRVTGSSYVNGINIYDSNITAGNGGLNMNGSAVGSITGAGIYMPKAQISSNGNIRITGNASNEGSGNEGFNQGVVIGDSYWGNTTTNIQTTAGNIIIKGVGGTSAGTYNEGLIIDTGSSVKNTGTGAITIEATAGGNSVGALISGTVQANNSAITVKTDVGDVRLDAGAAISSNANSNAVIIAPATGYNFINNAGNTSLSAINGRWIVYSNKESDTQTGGLSADNTVAGKSYNELLPTDSSMPTGNVFVYKIGNKYLIITANNIEVIYGESIPAYQYILTDSVTQTTISNDALTSTPTLSISGCSGNVGDYTINVDASGVGIDSNYSGYMLSTSSGILTIKPRPIIITPNSGQSKVYGNPDPELTYTVGNGNGTTGNSLVGSDILVGKLSYTGVNVGNYAMNLGNLNNSNYNITLAANPVTFAITPRPLTITAVGQTKTYDGGLTATAIPTYSGLVGSDTLSGLSEAYIDKNAGSNKTLRVTGYVVNDGNSGGNYTVTTVDNSNGVITPKVLSISGLTVNDKVYNGDIDAVLNGSATLLGLLGTDNVSLTGTTTGEFANKNVGENKIVTIHGMNLVGADAQNYNLGTITATGRITPASLTITAVGQTKTYDGGLTATAIPTYSGLVGSDTLSGLSEAYIDKNAGSNKTLRVTGYVVNDGNSGGNYTVTTVDNTTGDINPAVLIVKANDNNKIYNGLAYSGGNGISYSGFVNNETSAELGGTLRYGGTAQGAVNPGSYTITPSGLTSNNYIINFVDGNLTITPVVSSDNQYQTVVTTVTNQISNTQIMSNMSVVNSPGISEQSSSSLPAGVEMRNGGVTMPSISDSAPSINSFSSGQISLTTGNGFANRITVTESNGALTVSRSGNNVSSPVSQESRGISIISVGEQSAPVVGTYQVNYSSNSLTVVASAEKASWVIPAERPENAASGTFRLTGADGTTAEFKVVYADGAISIKPANQLAVELVKDQETADRLLAATGMLAVEEQLGVPIDKISAIYIHR